jgi:hypothetical protein
VGIVDADALPINERSPVAPSTFTAATLVVRFRFEACLTRGMVASSVRLVKALGKRAPDECGAQGLPVAAEGEIFHRVPVHLYERDRHMAATVERAPPLRTSYPWTRLI